MEIKRAIEILDKAIGRIPYRSIDIRLVLGTEEIEYHDVRHNPMGFLPPNVTVTPKKMPLDAHKEELDGR